MAPRWRERLLAFLFAFLTLSSITMTIVYRQPKGLGDDYIQDFLSARERMSGRDPFSDLDKLRVASGFRPFGGDGVVPANPHPPVAILLVMPVAAFDWDYSLLLFRLLQCAFLAAALVWCGDQLLSTRSVAFALSAATAVSFWSPVWQGLDWGQPVGLMTLWVVMIWHGYKFAHPGLLGAVGMAALLTRPLYVLLVPIALSYGSRFVLVSMTFGFVTALLCFVAMADTPWDWATRAVAVREFIDVNASLASVLGLNVIGGGIFVIAGLLGVWFASKYQASVDETMSLGISLALITYPMAWFFFDALLVPVLIWLFSRSQESSEKSWCRYLAFGFFLIRAIPAIQGGGYPQQLLHTLARVSIVLAIAYICLQSKRTTRLVGKEREIGTDV